jgi:hypothetical protein
VELQGETAIPIGTYKLSMNSQSNRVLKPGDSWNKKYLAGTNGYMPHIQGVPGFEGIRIHIGRNHTWSHGCILVGKVNGNNNGLDDSDHYFWNIVYARLKNEKTQG